MNELRLRPSTDKDIRHLAECLRIDPWHSREKLESWVNVSGGLSTVYDAGGPLFHLAFTEEGRTLRLHAQFDPRSPKVRTAQKAADIVLVDTPPGMPEVAYQAMLLADLVLLPCGPSPLDLFPLKEALGLALKARAERRSKKPRIRFVPSKVLKNTNLGRGLTSSLEEMGKKVLPGIGQRIVVAEAVTSGLTVREYAPGSTAQEEFEQLAKAVNKIVGR